MNIHDDFMNFCSASSSSSEYSILSQIKEINPNIDIHSIDLDDKDNLFKTNHTSLIINIILSVFYSSYDHKLTDIHELREHITSAIECGNLMFFKHITQIESAKLRNGYTEILSKSMDDSIVYRPEDETEGNPKMI